MANVLTIPQAQSDTWTQLAPTNVLVLPSGQPIASQYPNKVVELGQNGQARLWSSGTCFLCGAALHERATGLWYIAVCCPRCDCSAAPQCPPVSGPCPPGTDPSTLTCGDITEEGPAGIALAMEGLLPGMSSPVTLGQLFPGWGLSAMGVAPTQVAVFDSWAIVCADAPNPISVSVRVVPATVGGGNVDPPVPRELSHHLSHVTSAYTPHPADFVARARITQSRVVTIAPPPRPGPHLPTAAIAGIPCGCETAGEEESL